MIVYISLLLATIVSLIIYKKTGLKFFSILPYFLMAMVGGFRENVGADYESYKYQFAEIVQQIGWSHNFEPGFKMIVRSLDLLGMSYQAMFLLFSVLTCYFYYRFIVEFSGDYIVSTIMFLCLGPFYLNSLNAVRQSLAISIFLFSIRYLNNDFKKFIFCMLVSSSIHISALFFLFISIILRIYKPIFIQLKKSVAFIAIFAIFISYIAFKLNYVELLFGKFFASRINLLGYGLSMDRSYLAYMIVCFGILIANRRWRLCIKPIFICMLVYTCALIALAFMVPGLGMVFTRLISWGSPAIIVTLPELKRVVKPQFIYRIFLSVSCALYYFLLINSSGAKLLPYSINVNLLK